MDRGRLAVLRQKLVALGYQETLDENNALLVARLVEDLMKITESYRNEK